jgi:hypothetical protein
LLPGPANTLAVPRVELDDDRVPEDELPDGRIVATLRLDPDVPDPALWPPPPKLRNIVEPRVPLALLVLPMLPRAPPSP